MTQERFKYLEDKHNSIIELCEIQKEFHNYIFDAKNKNSSMRYGFVNDTGLQQCNIYSIRIQKLKDIILERTN